MKTLQNKYTGISLIEFMVALTLSLLVIALCFQAFFLVKKTTVHETALLQLTDKINLLFATLGRDILLSDKVEPFSPQGGILLTRAHVNHGYFIAKTHRMRAKGQTVCSLFRQDTQHHERELIAGISQLQLRFGVIRRGNIHYIAARAVNHWRAVVSVSCHLKVCVGFYHMICIPWEGIFALSPKK